MNILMIILILILFSGIYGLDRNQLIGIDVIGTLKEKNTSCDLRNFVKSTNGSENDYKTLIHDLTKYCSISNSIKLYRLLCRIILIELEIGCLLPKNSRRLPIKYSISNTPIEICSMNRISQTNSWIWGKLTSDEKKEIGPTSHNLCPILTSLNSTLRLARFFYKIAPRIIQIDLTKKESEDSIFNKIQIVGEISFNKTNNTKNKINRILDLKQVNGKEQNLANEMKKKEEGLPLGRVGENPKRKQMNKRPKPKVLDIETDFKANENDKQIWVEGRHNADEPENTRNRFSRVKMENNQLGKQKLKSNKHNDNLLNKFITTFLVFILCIVIIYLILRNKNKVLALIIEVGKGRRVAVNRRMRLSQTN